MVISTEGALRKPVTKCLIHYYFYFPISLFLCCKDIAHNAIKSKYNDVL